MASSSAPYSTYHHQQHPQQQQNHSTSSTTSHPTSLSTATAPTPLNSLTTTGARPLVLDASSSISMAPPPPPSQGYSSQQAPPGTADNPLIPKRRRRTSPDELIVLERAFAVNALPSQAERAELSARIGMTGRALQVWFQNRRQKEKKDANSYHGSAASSAGSAPDPDRDSVDLEGLQFAFSSSPARTTTSDRLTPSEELYNYPIPLHHNTNNNKENHPASPLSQAAALAPLPAPPSPPTPAAPTPSHASHYIYSYPSNNIPPPPSITSDRGVYVHRPSTSSIIAAKKHVRKRPLGSHAPLARKPSLSHSFNFPPSPPKKTSSGRNSSTTNNKKDLNASTARPSLKRAASSSGSVASTASGISLFSLQTNDAGRARVWVDELNKARKEGGVEALGSEEDAIGEDDPDAVAPTTTLQPPAVVVEQHRGFKTKDEVWQHMQSDAPSSPQGPGGTGAFSPAPLTRKMMLAHAAFSSSLDSSPPPPLPSSSHHHHHLSSILPSPVPMRKPLVRALSLGGSSSRAATEGSRAGGEEACAISAFERKRARIMGDDLPSSSSSSSSSSPVVIVGGRPKRINAGKRRSSREMVSSAEMVIDELDGGGGDSSMDTSMGDLSFGSSTSTAPSSIGTPVVEAGGYFSLLAAASKVDAQAALARKNVGGGGNQEDDERECAELLLGLGGFM